MEQTLTRALLERFHKRWPELASNLTSDEYDFELLVPGRPEHRLYIDIHTGEATLSYSDGLPPGPAEQMFVWESLDDAGAAEQVLNVLATFVQGDLIVVREPLSSVVRLLRGHDCDSLLSFARAHDLADWPPSRRHRVIAAWSWNGPYQLAI